VTTVIVEVLNAGLVPMESIAKIASSLPSSAPSNGKQSEEEIHQDQVPQPHQALE